MRFVEVFAGAYASGKSETSINRALQFARKGEKITLVDLDTVEPAYTLLHLHRLIVCRLMGISLLM